MFSYKYRYARQLAFSFKPDGRLVWVWLTFIYLKILSLATTPYLLERLKLLPDDPPPRPAPRTPAHITPAISSDKESEVPK